MKKNRFPLAGTRANRPSDDLQAERPLLLNPYEAADFVPAPVSVEEQHNLLIAQTTVHLGFVFEIGDDVVQPTGIIRGLTEQGECSVKIYDLNRSPLVRNRIERQNAAIEKLENRYFRVKFNVLVEDLTDQSQDSSAAIRATVQAWRWLQQKKLGSIG